MTLDIPAIRLNNQLLSRHDLKTPVEVVSHFGAMQAQDYQMAKWAVGARLSASNDMRVEKAIDDGSIIRTHVLRPTWHFVAAEDIGWMLALTGQNIVRAMAGTNRLLGLDDKILGKANDVIVAALESGKHLKRESLTEILNSKGIDTSSVRGLHITLNAELSQLICSGKRDGKNHTYALFADRVKKSKQLSRDEALQELAKRYFKSHGPATLKDFVWWSGLGVADAKKALALNEKYLSGIELHGQSYWFHDSGEIKAFPEVMLLPAFDEYLIAYKDRRASIKDDHAEHAFTRNGIFRPLVLVHGQVAGTWKRAIKKDTVSIEPNLLQKLTKTQLKQLQDEAARYADFLGCKAEVKL